MDCNVTTTEPAPGYYFACCSAHGTSSSTGVVRSTVEYRLSVACVRAELDTPPAPSLSDEHVDYDLDSTPFA